VLGIWHAPPAERLSAVRLTLFALNACVGVLFLLRAPLGRGASPFALAAAIPSMVLGGLALRWAPNPLSWPAYAQVAFVAAAAWTVTSLLTLGRSFALLPGLRALVVHGPFRILRHPIYAGEITMIAACGLAHSGWAALAWAAAAAALVAPRVIAEERLLTGEAAWAAYAERVRWRLLPGIW
jgi:protein-S-isoprenylcysteine O-methyltransferase Ste14